jgi:molybdopterin molybdotransferase
VTAELLLKPLIAHLSGAIEPQPRPVTMTAAAPFPAVGNRTDFVRARRVAGGLGPVRTGDSGAVFPLAEADALVIRAAGSMALAAGAPVEALLLA